MTPIIRECIEVLFASYVSEKSIDDSHPDRVSFVAHGLGWPHHSHSPQGPSQNSSLLAMIGLSSQGFKDKKRKCTDVLSDDAPNVICKPS